VITVAYNPEASTIGAPIIQEDLAGNQITAHDWRLVAAKPAVVPGFTRNQQTLFEREHFHGHQAESRSETFARLTSE
jgi:hypothetical protein